MKKVGLLTFHNASNFGAVLQAYALQKAVEQLGHMAQFVDYQCPALIRDYDPLGTGSALKQFVKQYVIPVARVKKKANAAFAAFVHENLSLSAQQYHTQKDLGSCETAYDAFIAGSDQIWNDTLVDFDPAYFLTFVSDRNKKNAYAASFGFHEIPKQLQAEYLARLQDFRHISIRESSGASILKGLLNRDVPVCVDPTLLLTGENWAKLASASRVPVKPYVLVYNVRAPKTDIAVMKALARKKHMTFVILDMDYRYMAMHPLDKHHPQACSPSEFLGLFANASYVLTNSFHGTVFSIQFHRPFLSELQDIDGNVNHRAKDLLQMLGLPSRKLGQDWQAVIDQPIDWLAVENRLQSARVKSLAYLREVLDEQPK